MDLERILFLLGWAMSAGYRHPHRVVSRLESGDIGRNFLCRVLGRGDTLQVILSGVSQYYLAEASLDAERRLLLTVTRQATFQSSLEEATRQFCDALAADGEGSWNEVDVRRPEERRMRNLLHVRERRGADE